MKTYQEVGGTVAFVSVTIGNGAGKPGRAHFAAIVSGEDYLPRRALKSCLSARFRVGATSRIPSAADSIFSSYVANALARPLGTTKIGQSPEYRAGSTVWH